MKKTILILCATFSLACCGTMAFAAETDVAETAKTAYDSKIEKVVFDDEVFVPVRAVYEEMGAEVFWNESDSSVTIKKDKTTIKMKLGSRIVNLNGKNSVIKKPLLMINGSVYVLAESVETDLARENELNDEASGDADNLGEDENFLDSNDETEDMPEIMYSKRPGAKFVSFDDGTPKVSCSFDVFNVTEMKKINDDYIRIDILMSGNVKYNIDALGNNNVGTKSVRVYLICYDDDGKKIAHNTVMVKDESFEITKSLNIPAKTRRISLELER